MTADFGLLRLIPAIDAHQRRVAERLRSLDRQREELVTELNWIGHNRYFVVAAATGQVAGDNRERIAELIKYYGDELPEDARPRLLDNVSRVHERCGVLVTEQQAALIDNGTDRQIARAVVDRVLAQHPAEDQR